MKTIAMNVHLVTLVKCNKKKQLLATITIGLIK